MSDDSKAIAKDMLQHADDTFDAKLAVERQTARQSLIDDWNALSCDKKVKVGAELESTKTPENQYGQRVEAKFQEKTVGVIDRLILYKTQPRDQIYSFPTQPHNVITIEDPFKACKK
jgi:hypothetical protein